VSASGGVGPRMFQPSGNRYNLTRVVGLVLTLVVGSMKLHPSSLSDKVIGKLDAYQEN
ncbi:uncharacterized protein METZ01_LOCUS420730, partial [marine metagenome]